MFTPYEYDVMQDAGFMLAKRSVTEKVEALLAGLQQELERELSSDFSALNKHLGIQLHGPKISKGENYRGLPYMVLDYPRYFDKDDVFALRSMFWWGNFFSFTIHLQGGIWEKMKERIVIPPIYYDEVYLSSGETPWEYHYEPSNYIPVNSNNAGEALERCKQKAFIKLSIKLPLQTPPEQILRAGKEFYKNILNQILP